MESNSKITAVLTCFNRKDSTLQCLQLLKAAADQANSTLAAVLVDDGSTDGTAEAVTAAYDWVKVQRSDGSLFWNRGMHLAIESASKTPTDFILWINDDTHLLPDAIVKLLATYKDYSRRTNKPVIVVGATADRESGHLTYGGQIAVSKCRPFSFRKAWSKTEAVECDAMNGNLVLVPQEIFAVVGNLDPVFEHAMGDIDYGLRARKAGFAVVVAPGFVGHCSNNPVKGTYQDTSLPFKVRWQKMLSKKGLPVKSWKQLTSKHGGLLWPLYFIWPYLKLLTQASKIALKNLFKGVN